MQHLKDGKSLFSITKQRFCQKQMSSGRFEETEKIFFYLIAFSIFLENRSLNGFLLSKLGASGVSIAIGVPCLFSFGFDSFVFSEHLQ